MATPLKWRGFTCHTRRSCFREEDSVYSIQVCYLFGGYQAPAVAPGRFHGDDAAAGRHLATAGADQSYAAAPPGIDKLHRLMIQASQGLVQPKPDEGKGR